MLISHAAPSASHVSVAVATITGLHSAKSHEIGQLTSGHSDSLDDKKNNYTGEESETGPARSAIALRLAPTMIIICLVDIANEL